LCRLTARLNFPLGLGYKKALEKRVIGLRLIDVKHSGINIAEHVETVVFLSLV
jgi:hypothetical protein